jgi:methylenetetrahydrofolate dehydrogenase (NADP+)/methenyltetrahydrofolate cyclohydrolase
MTVLNGRALAKALAAPLRERISQLTRAPGLAVVLCGSDPASSVYVRKKTARATRLGFHQRSIEIPDSTTQEELMALIDDLNADESIDGILVQLPLPEHLNSQPLLDRIDPAKDVDGFHPQNLGLLAQGRPHLVPCTPLGVMRLLQSVDAPLEGAHAVVVSRSNIVGRPMAMLLEKANATVTLCHSRTRDLPAILATADVVVAAVGRPHFVKGEWIREGAIVIDVGINRLDDGSLVGDVDYDAAEGRAQAITPVPGGVGPMTIAMLMENTVTASEARQRN